LIPLLDYGSSPLSDRDCYTIALSADSRVALIAERKRGKDRVRLWDLEARKPLPDLSPGFVLAKDYHIDPPQAFSADGKTLLLSADSTLRVFDTRTGKERGGPGHRAPVMPRFSADGRTLFTTCSERRCSWNVAPGKKPALLTHQPRKAWEVDALAHSADGRLFLDKSWPKVRVREAATSRVLRELETHGYAHEGLFSPDATRVLLQYPANEKKPREHPEVFRLFDVKTGKVSGQIKPKGSVGLPVFSPNGRLVAWADRANAVHLHDAVTGKAVRSLRSSVPLPERECADAGLVFSPTASTSLEPSLHQTETESMSPPAVRSSDDCPLPDRRTGRATTYPWETDMLCTITRRAALAALAGLAAKTWAAEPRPRLPRDNLLVYRGTDGKPVPVKTAADWAKRRAEIVRGMESVMGKLPGKEKRCALDAKTENEVDGGSYVRRLITYASEPGSRVPAYLLIPKDVLKGKKKVPAVLCLHGTDNVVGHGIVVGLGKRPNRGYALELAKRGYVTLAPNYPLLAKYQPDLKKLGWESGTLKAVWDNRRGLDLLASLPFVDGTKMGAIGHSLGGHNSVYTAVFDDRLKVIVSSCGLDSYLDYYKGDEKNWEPERGWCQTRYMRKLADYKGRLADIPFDFHEMIGALAPRHVLIIAPKKDSNFRADSVDRIVAAARPVFKLLGHEDRLMVEHPDCGHDFPVEMREKAYRLFDRVLGGKAPRR
jgi:hypothetical protein